MRLSITPPVRRLVMVLSAVVGAWALLAGVRALASDSLGELELARVDTARVDTVMIARASDSTLMVRAPGNQWRVNGFRADTARVHELLRALLDTSAWSEQTAQSSASHARLGVDADSGRRFRVVTGTRTPIDLVIGRRTADWNGLFVRRQGEEAAYALHATGLATSLTRESDDWRDRGIVAVTPDSVESVLLTRGSRTSTLRRNDGRWTLNGAPADSSAVATLLEAWRAVSAAGFATSEQADSARFAKLRASVTLRSRGGGTLASVSLDSVGATVIARARDDSVVYRIDQWHLGRLVPADSTLRRK